MATLRELKGRIGSVASSEKITGAMKMISSAKMHKAEGALRRLQPYRKGIEGIIGNLLGTDAEFTSPLIEARPIERMAVVVFGSDDGLCGAYNVNISKRLEEHLRRLRSEGIEGEIVLIPVGSKIAKQVVKLPRKMEKLSCELPQEVNSKSEGQSVVDFNTYLKDKFISGGFDRVDLLYMNFQTMSRQRPASMQFLPVLQSSFKGIAASNRPYLFEPDAETIFNTVLPMYMLSVMQDVFVENRASEQAARVMAMQSANDNAKKLLEQLRLEYNKLRQQSITTELLDIVGGQARD